MSVREKNDIFDPWKDLETTQKSMFFLNVKIEQFHQFSFDKTG